MCLQLFLHSERALGSQKMNYFAAAASVPLQPFPLGVRMLRRCPELEPNRPPAARPMSARALCAVWSRCRERFVGGGDGGADGAGGRRCCRCVRRPFVKLAWSAVPRTRLTADDIYRLAHAHRMFVPHDRETASLCPRSACVLASRLHARAPHMCLCIPCSYSRRVHLACLFLRLAAAPYRRRSSSPPLLLLLFANAPLRRCSSSPLLIFAADPLRRHSSPACGCTSVCINSPLARERGHWLITRHWIFASFVCPRTSAGAPQKSRPSTRDQNIITSF
jgi:hypothetical protein